MKELIRKEIVVTSRHKRANINKPKKVLSKEEVDKGHFFSLYNVLKAYHTLPLPGGVLDQDSYFMFLVNWAQQMEEVRQELDNHDSEVKASQGGR